MKKHKPRLPEIAGVFRPGSEICGEIWGGGGEEKSPAGAGLWDSCGSDREADVVSHDRKSLQAAIGSRCSA